MNLKLIKMNLKSVFCTLLIIILSINGISSMAIFGSRPGEAETSPSIQLMLRNFGLGLVTDPIFYRIKKRWDTLRTSPLFFALISDATGNKQQNAQAVINKAVKLLARELN